MNEMNESEDSNGPTKQNSKSKLAKLLRKYDLPELGDELEARWTADREERMSLRDLADYVNKELLIATIDDPTVLDEDIETYYQLLTGDNVSTGTRIQIKNQLVENGVNVEELRDDFVSRQSVHTYLTKECDATYEPENPEGSQRIKARVEAVQRLKNRVQQVSEAVISELNNANLLSAGTPHVSVFVRVDCHDCEQEYTLTEFLTEGGCNCESENKTIS
jgi:hypothetical protein